MARSHARAPGSLALALVLSGCGALHVGGGGNLDVGSYVADGLASGAGGHAEVGISARPNGNGPGAWLTVTRLGYASEVDADPVWVPALEARWATTMEHPTAGLHPLLELGAGVGAGVTGSLHSLAIPLHGAIGVAIPMERLHVKLTARARPFLFVSGGSPPFDGAGSLQLGATLVIPLTRP